MRNSENVDKNSNELKNIPEKNNQNKIQNNQKSSSKPYMFCLNDNNQNVETKIKNNKISTTKYNFITFLPKALLYQFMRLANVYFLIMAILQCIPEISPLSPLTAIVPIVFVLSVSVIREGIEDFGRYNYDKLSNKEKVRVHRNGKWIQAESESLRVGEIIAVTDEESFPADLILLDSSLPEGICYIETAQLDGEKTLKFKKSHNKISDKFKDESKNNKYTEKFKISGICTCDKPSDVLYKLDGNVKISLDIDNSNAQKNIAKEPENDVLINRKSEENQLKSEQNPENNHRFNIEGDLKDESMALDAKQLLLKGAILKNTEWVVGFVVYTGHSTKLMLNSKKGRVKFSKVEQRMSTYLIYILILQTLFCITCACLFGLIYISNIKENYFLSGFVDNVIIDSIINYFTYLLLLNTMIPISLIITLEITKVIQGYMITLDVKLFSKIRQKFCKAGSVSLNEELGQVDYIFSDKTGTLTCNKMKFKYCVIADVCHEFVRKNEVNLDETKMTRKEIDEKNAQINFRKEKNIQTFTEKHLNSLKNSVGIEINKSKYPNFKVVSNSNSSVSLLLDDNHKIHEEFFKALALNNECVVNNKKGYLEYSGLSPDDIELVTASGMIGCELMKSNSTKEKKLSITNEEKIFEILNTIEFTSERKKSSIVVRDGEYIKLYIKGADSEMVPILHRDTDPHFKDQSAEFIELFSRLGYRTLMVGMKIFSKEEYKELNDKYTELSMSVEADKQQKMDLLNKEFEKDIYLLGSTIVEDRLQDSVPETIRDLRLAAIKIWMLTGDKIDTAENIGKSCNLINDDLKLFKITNQRNYTFDDFVSNFDQYLAKKNLTISDYINKKENLPEYSILIDLKETKSDFLDKEKEMKFVEISKFAKSVICSRCSPGQKSEVVKMIKESDKSLVTLSIGDGGNDVPMITEAHIGKIIYYLNLGIGVYGEEGVMAIQASDFAIGEFKFLRRLLLFHGRTNYMRISELILYFFFKNFIFTITHFYFGFFNNFSGQTIIDDWLISMYNMIFTAFPLGARATLDHDIHPNDGKVALMFQPFIYEENKKSPIFTLKKFSLELLRGIIYGGLNYFCLYFSLRLNPVDGDGYIADMWYFSTNCYTNIILIVSIHLIIKSKYITILNFLTMLILSWIAYVGFLFFIHFAIMFKSCATMYVSFTSALLYLNLVILVGLVCLIDFFLYSWNTNFSGSILSTLMVERKNKGSLETYHDLPKNLDKYVRRGNPVKEKNGNNLNAQKIEISDRNSENKNRNKNLQNFQNMNRIKDNIDQMMDNQPEVLFNNREE